MSSWLHACDLGDDVHAGLAYRREAWLGGAGRLRGRRLLGTAEDGVYDNLVLHLEGVGSREVLVGPDGEAADSLLLGELGVGPIDGLAGGVRVVQDEGGVDLDRGAPGETDDHGVDDARVLDQDALDVLGIDVLTAGKHDHVLDAALDVKEALVVEVAEVARLVPAVLESPGRLLRGVVVAGSDVLPLHQDFALHR